MSIVLAEDLRMLESCDRGGGIFLFRLHRLQHVFAYTLDRRRIAVLCEMIEENAVTS